jgi:hypothetical protein
MKMQGNAYRKPTREALIKANCMKQTTEKRGIYAELKSISVGFRAFRGFYTN